MPVIDFAEFKCRMVDSAYRHEAESRARLIAAMARLQEQWEAMIDAGEIPTEAEAERFYWAWELGQQLLNESDED